MHFLDNLNHLQRVCECVFTLVSLYTIIVGLYIIIIVTIIFPMKFWWQIDVDVMFRRYDVGSMSIRYQILSKFIAVLKRDYNIRKPE